MPMQNLIKYGSNHSKITGRLLFYSEEEATIFNTNIENPNNFNSFMYNAKLNNCCPIKIFK